jgi:hypothetical protein
MQNMQLSAGHLVAVSDFRYLQISASGIPKTSFSAENDNNLKRACGVMKISKIGDCQTMRHLKLHISCAKY